MKWGLICILILFTVTEIGAKRDKILSRKRRFVSFPDGSSFAASVCMTIGVIGNPVLEYLSWAVNWGIAYELPNETWARQQAHGFKNKLISHNVERNRYRRELYEGIEFALNSMGFDGRECIGRTLCESSTFLEDRKGNMLEEIIKTVFRFPTYDERAHLDPDAHYYDKAFSLGRIDQDCQRQYPNCHFSIIELALGEYSVELTKHGPKRFFSFM